MNISEEFIGVCIICDSLVRYSFANEETQLAVLHEVGAPIHMRICYERWLAEQRANA